jgi:hypothetical protein
MTRLAIRVERLAEAWRRAVEELHSSERIRKTVMRKRTRGVQVRRRDLHILRLASESCRYVVARWLRSPHETAYTCLI